MFKLSTKILKFDSFPHRMVRKFRKERHDVTTDNFHLSMISSVKAKILQTNPQDLSCVYSSYEKEIKSRVMNNNVVDKKK